MADASDVVCTITNARNTGTLTVTKVVTNDNGGQAACQVPLGFKVNNGSTIGFEADCTNVLTLPTGTYSVAEPAVRRLCHDLRELHRRRRDGEPERDLHRHE